MTRVWPLAGAGKRVSGSCWAELRRLAFQPESTVSSQVRRAIGDFLARRRKKGAKQL